MGNDKPVIAFPDGSVPLTPWDTEAAFYARETGQPLAVCHDVAIARWLLEGNPQALTAWLECGRTPGPLTCRALHQLLIERDADAWPSVAYRLVPKKRRGRKGRPRNLEAVIRDLQLAENMERLKPALGWTGALARMKEALDEIGVGIDEQTIRKAHAKHYGKK